MKYKLGRSYYTLVELCWQNEFLKYQNGLATLNKSLICDYLCVSKRTLNRWLGGESACPRAVKLLFLKHENVHAAMPDFYFDKDKKLGHTDWKYTYSLDEIKLFPELLKEKFRLENRHEMMVRHVDNALDRHEQNKQLDALNQAIKALLGVKNSPLFEANKEIEQTFSMFKHSKV